MRTLLCAATICLVVGRLQGVLIHEPFDYAWQIMGTTGGASGTDPSTVASGSLTGVAGLPPAIRML